MAKAGRKRKRNTVFGKKLERLNEISKNPDFSQFAGYLGIAEGTFYTYLNGDSMPSVKKLWDFVAEYATDHGKKVIDLNWLLDDNNRRLEPVFTEGEPSTQEERQEEVSDSIKEPVKPPEADFSPLDRRSVPPGSWPAVVEGPVPQATLEWYESPPPVAVIRGAAAADSSNGMRVPDHDEIGELEYPPEGLTHVPVVGDSMAPILYDGQRVLIDKDREGVEDDGGIVVVTTMTPEHTFENYVKRCFRDGDSYILESEADYPDIIIPAFNCRVWPVIGTWYPKQIKYLRRKRFR